MRILRWAGWTLLGLIGLIVVSTISARLYQSYRAWSLPRAFAAAHPEAGALDASERVMLMAREVVAGIKTTEYSHWTSINEADGVYNADCSGLACYLLRNAARTSHDGVPLVFLGHRAHAIGFYRAFVAAPDSGCVDGWQRIRSMADARAGDFIAWTYPWNPWWKDSGHVMTIMDTPVAESDSLYRVTILDASHGGHADDSRKSGGTGVGTGTMWFTVDEAGSPIAYHWWTPEKSVSPPIAIGRPVGP